MIQDATNQQIKAIQNQFPLTGKTVLEIGCGKGRVTADLAKLAARVIAADPDPAALETARRRARAHNIEFIHAASGIPLLEKQSVDLAIYTLSLHHVPEREMQASLLNAGGLLKPGGVLLVLEPGDGGSFNEAKTRFGVGSGDEGPLKAAALQAMRTLPGWQLGPPHHFFTEFWFSDESDFFASKLPNFADLPAVQQQDIRSFLQLHRQPDKIVLTSERSLYRLQPF